MRGQRTEQRWTRIVPLAQKTCRSTELQERRLDLDNIHSRWLLLGFPESGRAGVDASAKDTMLYYFLSLSVVKCR